MCVVASIVNLLWNLSSSPPCLYVSRQVTVAVFFVPIGFDRPRRLGFEPED